MFVGASIHHDIATDFSYTGAPFLMGTVALGKMDSIGNLIFKILKFKLLKFIESYFLFHFGNSCAYVFTGGVINIMPLLYKKIKPIENQVDIYVYQ